MVVRKVWQKDNGANMLTTSGLLLEGEYTISKTEEKGVIKLTCIQTNNGD